MLNYAEQHAFEIDVVNTDLYCLVAATIDNRLDMIKFILDFLDKKKIEMKKIKFRDNMTPLHFASEKGQLEIVKYYVQNKIFKTNLKDDYKHTPIYYAKRNNNHEVVNFLNGAK